MLSNLERIYLKFVLNQFHKNSKVCKCIRLVLLHTMLLFDAIYLTIFRKRFFFGQPALFVELQVC